MGAELGREVHLVMKVLKEKISSDCFKFLSNVGKKRGQLRVKMK